MKKYKQNEWEVARIEALLELQKGRLQDLFTGDISKEDCNELQQNITDKLAHMCLTFHRWYFTRRL